MRQLLILLLIALALGMFAYSIWVDPDGISLVREDGSRISELQR